MVVFVDAVFINLHMGCSIKCNTTTKRGYSLKFLLPSPFEGNLLQLPFEGKPDMPGS